MSRSRRRTQKVPNSLFSKNLNFPPPKQAYFKTFDYFTTMRFVEPFYDIKLTPDETQKVPESPKYRIFMQNLSEFGFSAKKQIIIQHLGDFTTTRFVEPIYGIKLTPDESQNVPESPKYRIFMQNLTEFEIPAKSD